LIVENRLEPVFVHRDTRTGEGGRESTRERCLALRTAVAYSVAKGALVDAFNCGWGQLCVGWGGAKRVKRRGERSKLTCPRTSGLLWVGSCKDALVQLDMALPHTRTAVRRQLFA
jgi:hypothetical protein